MKTQKRKILENILRYFAIKVLAKHQPQVVAITGSIGKTTTKEAVAQVLKTKFSVRQNEKNFNNEVGVPLTIIDGIYGGSSIFKWLLNVFAWLKSYFSSDYPEVLVLEMGADRPGDIKYLCDFVPVQVGILTYVGNSHLEYFKTRANIAKEKGQLLRSVPIGGLSAANFDSPEARDLLSKIKSNILSYGFEEGAMMRASDVVFNYQDSGENIKIFNGISFKLNFEGKIIPIKLPHCMGKAQIYSVLAALATSYYFKINLMDAIEALKDFYPPKGRMIKLSGIKNTVIIDDTYNSAPDSAKSALETLSAIDAKRKIAVLGDMLELGEGEKSGHVEVGSAVARSGTDFFVAVGSRMRSAKEEFDKILGTNEKSKWFATSENSKMFVQEIIKPGDLILIKGSQGMRMEKVVEEIMAEPEKKQNLLVRQDDYWKTKAVEEV